MCVCVRVPVFGRMDEERGECCRTALTRQNYGRKRIEMITAGGGDRIEKMADAPRHKSRKTVMGESSGWLSPFAAEPQKKFLN